jgi:hypothetical protein
MLINSPAIPWQDFHELSRLPRWTQASPPFLCFSLPCRNGCISAHQWDKEQPATQQPETYKRSNNLLKNNSKFKNWQLLLKISYLELKNCFKNFLDHVKLAQKKSGLVCFPLICGAHPCNSEGKIKIILQNKSKIKVISLKSCQPKSILIPHNLF